MRKVYTVCIFLGLLLIAAALSLIGYNLFDEMKAEKSSEKALEQLILEIPTEKAEQTSGDRSDKASSGTSDVTSKRMPEQPTPPTTEEISPSEIEIPDYILNPNMDMPVKEIDGQEYIGKLEIPVLGIELPIISEWSYPRLKIAPCRYTGSAYLDNLTIAAHNYASHFGNIKKLSPGDEVIFTDLDGNIFHYVVASVEILQPTAIEEMTDSEYALTLFTCTIGGKSRVTVRCDKKE